MRRNTKPLSIQEIEDKIRERIEGDYILEQVYIIKEIYWDRTYQIEIDKRKIEFYKAGDYLYYNILR